MNAPWIGEMCTDARAAALIGRRVKYVDIADAILDAERRARAKALEEAAVAVSGMPWAMEVDRVRGVLEQAGHMLRTLAEPQP